MVLMRQVAEAVLVQKKPDRARTVRETKRKKTRTKMKRRSKMAR